MKLMKAEKDGWTGYFPLLESLTITMKITSTGSKITMSQSFGRLM